MSTGGCVLAIDLGKSWCRAALLAVPLDPVPPWPVARVPGATGLAETGGVQAAMHAVEAAMRSLDAERPGGSRVVAVGIGAAGSTAAPAAAQVLAAELERRTGAPAAVTSDAVTSHVGALGGNPGVVLAAGTGAVAVAVRAGENPADGGRVELVDGWGQWLGDEGSGAWIGRQGLRAALRAHDGRGPATALREAALTDFGTLERLPATLAAGGTLRATAAFAPRVLEAAGHGDDVALDVVHSAAARLAETTLTAVRRCGLAGPTPVALVGGLSEAGRALLDPWREALATADETVQLVDPLGDSLSGAGRVALRADLPHETAVVRSDRPAPAITLEDL